MAVAAARGWVLVCLESPPSLVVWEVGREGEALWQSDVGRLELSAAVTRVTVGAWEKRAYLTHGGEDRVTVVALD